MEKEKFNPFDQPEKDHSKMTSEEEQEARHMAGVVSPSEHAERMINSGDEKLKEVGEMQKREVEESMNQVVSKKEKLEFSQEEKELINIIKTEAEGWKNLKEAKQTAETETDESNKSYALSLIVEAQAEAGQIEEAKQTIEAINTEQFKFQALIFIAKSQAEAGQVEEAKRTAEVITNRNEKSRAFSLIAKSQIKAGQIEEAKRIAEDITHKFYKSRAFSLIAKSQAEAGQIEEAKLTIEAITDEQIRMEALSSITESQVKAGQTEETKKTFQEARQIAEALTDVYGKFEALISIAKAQAEAGQIEEAKQTTEAITDEDYKYKALLAITKAQAKAGQIEEAKRTAEVITNERQKKQLLLSLVYFQAKIAIKQLSEVNLKKDNINIDQIRAIIKKASSRKSIENRAIMKAIGATINETQRQELVKEFGEDAKDYLYAGYTEFRELDQEKDITNYYAKKIKQISQSPEVEIETEKLVTEILVNLKNEQAIQSLLEASRELPPESKQLPRIIKALCETGNTKAADLVVQFCGKKELPERIMWYAVHKLVEQEYLPASLGEYLKEKGRSSKVVESIRQVISRLRLNPDKEVLEYILDKEYYDENTGEKLEDIGKIINSLQEKKEKFETIRDRFELIETLYNDKESATLYYLLNGGKTRFSLINSYNSDKFRTILKVLNEELGDIDQEVLDKWQEVLNKSSNYSQEEQEKIKNNLIRGKWPFTNMEAKNQEGMMENQPRSVLEVNLDVSDSARLDNINQQSAFAFGKSQLGVILKIKTYQDFLRREGGEEFLQEINQSDGLTGAEEIIDRIEDKYPQIIKEVEMRLNKNWKKLGDKKVLESSLMGVLQEEENPINSKDLLKNLEDQRKALRSSMSKKFKALIKNNRDKKEELIQEKKSIMERLEAKDPSKLIGYIISETIGLTENDEDKTTEKLITEWESHLKSIFDDLKEIDQFGEQQKSKEQKVTLRYLDKKDDLVACLRFADSAQCCFTSSQYRIEDHDVGNAEWIARIWKDPLSYVYQIESNELEAKQREAIGFVFGFYGEKREKLAVMLNGIYMQKKTDKAAESILNTIENNLTKPMQADYQIFASRHGGSIKTPEKYGNIDENVIRFRALKSQYGDSEEKIYDDISTEVNKPIKLDSSVFEKKLK